MSGPNGKQGFGVLSLTMAILALLISGTALYITWSENTGPTASSLDEHHIHEMVRGYILENPEILPEAIGILRQREEAMQRDQLQAMASERWDDIRTDRFSPIADRKSVV